VSHLQTEIANLSTAEKFELLDLLWESVEAESVAVTDEQQPEIESRLERYRQNPPSAIPWEQVKAELLKKR
jgi:putative addiction module component (TIGR02574 family)